MKSTITQLFLILFVALIGVISAAPEDSEVQFDGLPSGIETAWHPGQSVSFKYKSTSYRPDQIVLSLANDRLSQKLRIDDGKGFYATASPDTQGWYQMNATAPSTVPMDTDWYLLVESRLLKRNLAKSRIFPILPMSSIPTAVTNETATTTGMLASATAITSTISNTGQPLTTMTQQANPTQMCRPRNKV